MIISVSRRTDIPAFYSEWFINRVKDGFLLTRSTQNAKIVKKVSLKPKDVDAFVFWTRNVSKLIPHLDFLDQSGYRYYFQYSLTGYGKELETSTLHPLKAIEDFKRLSSKISKEKVIWRYDPIIASSITPVSEHIRLFEKIAKSLHGYTDKVVISFADLYEKTRKNLNDVHGLAYYDILEKPDELHDICHNLSNIAQKYGLEISSCSESVNLSKYGIEKGKCIDGDLINRLFDLNLSKSKDASQRLDCGCVKSIDIGTYDTCMHGCVYCYATENKAEAKENYKQHDPNSFFLIGDSKGYEFYASEISTQQSFF